MAVLLFPAGFRKTVFLHLYIECSIWLFPSSFLPPFLPFHSLHSFFPFFIPSIIHCFFLSILPPFLSSFVTPFLPSPFSFSIESFFPSILPCFFLSILSFFIPSFLFPSIPTYLFSFLHIIDSWNQGIYHLSSFIPFFLFPSIPTFLCSFTQQIANTSRYTSDMIFEGRY